MTSWDQVLSTALVGTDRRSSTVDAPGVLDAAAGWAIYRRAGQIADPGPVGQPIPAGPESLEAVDATAARRLTRLVAGEVAGIDAVMRGQLAGEWLSLAAEHGRRVPAAILPELLDYGRTHGDLRERIAAVAGARGQWLADQNPDWRYLTSVESTSDDPEVWTTGTRGQRVGHLRRLRGEDPDAARELLAGDWATLIPDERPDLLAVLADGLTPADAELLERALDDRRQVVRQSGADLLARLPDSAYANRMTERVRAALTLTDAGVVTAVTPPTACDPAMRRDGITSKPPAGIGERSWWLEEILARTPLTFWPAGFGIGPGAVEWATTIYSGLARAAATHGDSGWATAVFDRLGPAGRDRTLAASLYPLLSPEEVLRRTGEALQAGQAATWGLLLPYCPTPWPEPLSLAVLAGLGALTDRAELRAQRYQLIRVAALSLSPELGSTVEIPDDDLAAILRFRHEMTREILHDRDR